MKEKNYDVLPYDVEYPNISQPKYSVETMEAMIPMRDGVKLKTYICLPKGDAPFPALLARTSYGASSSGTYYASRGYAVLMQDCRGRFGSEGKWDPYTNDPKDGYDAIDWIVSQPWSNGKVGTYGASYLGYTQIAAGFKKHPNHLAMAPRAAPYPPIPSLEHTGGAFQFAQVFLWGSYVSGQRATNLANYDWLALMKKLPVISMLDDTDIDTTIFKSLMQDRWKRHNSFIEKVEDFNKVGAATFCSTGWYDHITPDVLDYYAGISVTDKNNPRFKRHRLTIGPWDHSGNGNPLGLLDFDPAAKTISAAEQIDVLRWMDHWLKDADTGWNSELPIRIFIMGANKWRYEEEWPLARTKYTPLYLHSRGNANSSSGDGTLSIARPDAESADTFVYDPDNPVPTIGGCNSGPCAHAKLTRGPYDQAPVEARKDVLVYMTDLLESAMEVTGLIKVILYASSSAVDTDFTAKLVDVHPNGQSLNLQDGIIRARYRESFLSEKMMKPGEIYKFEIDLWATGNLFKPGHRIGVEISSSNFPRFNRNLNTGENNETTADFVKATQTIYHNKENPSHILLPVIPSDS